MWNGYEQHPDAHPERPWWRIVRDAHLFSLVRIDGRRGPYAHANNIEGVAEIAAWVVRPNVVAAMADIDRTNPLPAPPPKCGQVWKMDTDEAMIVGRRPGLDFDGLVCVRWAWTTQDDLVPWPPEGCVLVAGPHSPWSPS
jgi:hypothetical protein